MKTVIALAALIAIASPALAAGKGEGNPQARTMAAALKGGGGGANSPLKATVESITGVSRPGGVASMVSGKNGAFGTGYGGWGNVGSNLTGGQVSNGPNPLD